MQRISFGGLIRVSAISVVMLVSAGCMDDFASRTSASNGADESSEPSISGTPVTQAKVNAQYRFAPLGSDDDGDPLTYSVKNLPVWANFDATTGVLSGLPGAADVGVHSNVVLSVSDGHNTAQLQPFSIEVVAVGSIAVTLTWLPPDTNSDGSPLTDLAGYRIYYGTDANALGNVMQVNNKGITSGVIEGLIPAHWYFAIRAYNSAGVESDLSGVLSAELS
jgi:hypothetical protein